jgi:hypothetical protein
MADIIRVNDPIVSCCLSSQFLNVLFIVSSIFPETSRCFNFCNVSRDMGKVLNKFPCIIKDVRFLFSEKVSYVSCHKLETMGSFTLSLSGNIFQCTCDNADFIEWIFQTNVILDVPNKHYKCLLTQNKLSLVYDK